MMHINRGFTSMLPRDKDEKPKEESYFKNELKFKILKKEFIISFKVNNVKE